MYIPGLNTRYVRSNIHTIDQYSPDSHEHQQEDEREQTYRSCISYVIKKVVRSIWYVVGKRLNDVPYKDRSMMATMALKLLKSMRIVVDSETSTERGEIVSRKLGGQNVVRLVCNTIETRIVSCCKHLSEHNKSMYDMLILSTFLRML